MPNVQTQMSPMMAGTPKFEDLFRLHYHKCLAFARRMSGNREEAEDLAQEAFYRAYRSFDRYDRQRPFDRWVYRIISNLFIDLLRTKNRAPTYSLDSPIPGKEGQGPIGDLPDSRQDPAQTLLADIMDERLVSALGRLSESYRRTLLLVDMQEMSYEEAAQYMGCAIGTVRSRVHRARKQLRVMLTDQGEPSEI